MEGVKGNVSLLGTKKCFFDQREQVGRRMMSGKMNKI